MQVRLVSKAFSRRFRSGSVLVPTTVTAPEGDGTEIRAEPGDKQDIQVMTAQGLHLFPFRTEKLNLVTPMVLRKRKSR